MGRGRAPCCDKSKVKRGPWNPAEDLRLITYIQKHGHGNWRALPKQSGLLRCGKSCRLRWINYLRPGVKRGNFTPQEEELIINLHQSLGNKWSKIASHLPGRTDNEIKNVWNTHLKKRLVMKKSETKELSSSSPSSPSSSLVSNTGIGGYDNNNKAVFDNTVVPSPSDHEPKQASSSSSSVSSYASIFGDSNKVDIINKPKEEMGSLGEPCEVHNHNNNSGSHNEMVEIPLESDIDFWNMLDNLGSLQSKEDQPQPQPHVFEASQSSKLRGEECVGEIECRKWLRYLECELGLEATTSDRDHGNGAENNACNEMVLKPEIDPYFQTWPSSHNFGV